ncbi:hypothetical protein CDAR_434931 [Caerostris darwini]|uniref:Uncharacterized protein n=1 Tax=Caerostris darwini TaxID=1538125 RepID=A0AAV4QF08_9ARAC|nr:hypothetical protein CDAR_434931 [Caerostris darwini]
MIPKFTHFAEPLNYCGTHPTACKHGLFHFPFLLPHFPSRKSPIFHKGREHLHDPPTTGLCKGKWLHSCTCSRFCNGVTYTLFRNRRFFSGHQDFGEALDSTLR